LDQPRYYNFLVDAWEAKYGDCRGAAIDRLEILCQEKFHLKTVAAAGTARSKKKKQIVDVSFLKAPTPQFLSPRKLPENVDKPRPTVKVSKVTVPAKLQKVKSMNISAFNRRSLQTSPFDEEDMMSIEGDISEQSRSPSPNANLIDNDKFLTQSIDSTSTELIVDNHLNLNNVLNNQ